MQNIADLPLKIWDGEWSDIANYNKQSSRFLVPKPIYLFRIIGCFTENRIQIVTNNFFLKKIFC